MSSCGLEEDPCALLSTTHANNRAHVLLLRPMKPREYDQVIMQEWQIYGIEPSAGWFTLRCSSLLIKWATHLFIDPQLHRETIL